MQFHYWIVRYVPDVARGEFVNIGLVLANSDGSAWAFRKAENLRRAATLSGASPSAASFWLKRLEYQVDALPFDGGAVGLSSGLTLESMARLRSRLNNQVQMTPPQTAVGDDIDTVADILFSTLVVDPPVRETDKQRLRAITGLANRFEQLIPTNHVRRNMRMDVGASGVRIDVAVDAPDFPVCLTQVWSFQAKDASRVEEKVLASAFAFERVRRHGGVLKPTKGQGDVVSVGADAQIGMLYLPAKTELQTRALRSAKEAWASLNVPAFPIGQEGNLVSMLSN